MIKAGDTVYFRADYAHGLVDEGEAIYDEEEHGVWVEVDHNGAFESIFVGLDELAEPV